MMGKRQNRAGFTLIELMIVVAVIAIIASIAIPKLMSSRLAANEAAAISTLRSVATAQAQLQSSGAVDTDADGAGEYGYFAELAGQKPLRISNAGVPAMGTVGTDELVPAILSSAFGTAMTTGEVPRQGYLFKIYLPGLTVGGLTPGIAEANTGGGTPGSLPNANNGEILWCCYAWPTDHNKTGNRAFFISQEGELLQCLNRGAAPYDGQTKKPGFSEALTVAGDMGSALRISTPGGADNTVWTPIQL